MKYRVWHIVNPPSEPIYAYVGSPEEAANRIDQAEHLYRNATWIEAEAWGLEVFNGEEWVEWCDEDGDDINSCKGREENQCK